MSSQATGVESIKSVVREVKDAVTPDLFAGELAAMGRLLNDLSGRLARRALRTQDIMVASKHAADELRALAAELETPDEADQRDRLLALSSELIKAYEALDER